MRRRGTRARALLWALGLMAGLAACQGPVVYERSPEPRHAEQESLLPCPHCAGQGIVSCEMCGGKGGWCCPTCEGFGLVQCPDCQLILMHTDPSPETDLYYETRTLGGAGTGTEPFTADLYATSHLHGIDRRATHTMSSLLLGGKRCPTCNSRGVLPCPDCDRGVRTCPRCGGRCYTVCPLCRGAAFVPSLTGEKVRSRGRVLRKRRR